MSVMADWYDRYCKDRRALREAGEDPCTEDLQRVASRLSYRASVVRAVRFGNMKNVAREARHEGEEVIQRFLNECRNREDIYKAWDDVRDVYKKCGINDYTYGNAQKWVNMALKYYIVLLWRFKRDYEELLQIPTFPVDRIMIGHIKRDYGIDFAGCWSGCDEKEQFVDYIEKVEKKVRGEKKSLFAYEMESWLK